MRKDEESAGKLDFAAWITRLKEAGFSDEEVKRIIRESQEKARELLSKNRHILDVLAQRLIEKETIESDELDSTNAAEKLQGVDGILVPGGFGSRGTGGMVAAAARKPTW